MDRDILYKKWPYLSEKYEPTYFDNFQALEQTCRLRPLLGSREKHLFFSDPCRSSL
jgi:hypothetical protein